jgi:hypothetical protein
VTEMTGEMRDRLLAMENPHHEAMQRAAAMTPDEAAREWLVTVPEYDDEGVVIDHFVITEAEAAIDKMRAAYNPQRGDRSTDAGTYTRLTVDGRIWMTDTPAEVRDHIICDAPMAEAESLLIVGLGMGMIVNRALTAHDIYRIDIVEIDPRVIRAVGPHYLRMGDDQGCDIRIHEADIHEWRPPNKATWDVGWFDIWPTINDEDMDEVKRLRSRFGRRLGWFGAWAQDERLAMRKRIRSGKWAY